MTPTEAHLHHRETETTGVNFTLLRGKTLKTSQLDNSWTTGQQDNRTTNVSCGEKEASDAASRESAKAALVQTHKLLTVLI